MAATRQANWSSRWAFIMATVGSAVGLGNIWKFPYEAGQGGGGAFVLIYLVFVFVIGTPMLIAELSIGRRGGLSPIGSMRKVALEEGRNGLWQLIGWSGVIGAFIILSFYSVIGGWTLAYVFKSIMGAFSDITPDGADVLFNALLSDPITLTIWHASFMAMTMGIVMRGVEGGLEKAVTLLMPALFVLLVFLVIYAGFTGAFKQAVVFLLIPDFSKLTFDVGIEALGQSFFSQSIAMGSIMTYGAYLSKDIKVGQAAVTISAADSAVAIMAGLAIFPLVFAYGLDVGGGPGLIFQTLPIAFGKMAFGAVVGALFFGLLLVAAITSSISLLEPGVSYLEHTHGIKRKKASTYAGAAAFLLGILTVLSFNTLSGFTIADMTFFDMFDFLTNNLLMPLGGMFVAMFIGWFMLRKNVMEELAMEDKWFRVWYFLIRFVSPVGVAVVFIWLLYGKFFAG